jgi:Pilin (bacterial filament)
MARSYNKNVLVLLQMNTNHFQVVITNQLKPDQDKNLITKKLAALFKIDEQKAAQFLLKPQTIIKDNLDEATANKYLVAIQQTGAHCRVINKNEVEDLPQIVEPPTSAPRASTPRSSSGPIIGTGREPELSLIAREAKTEHETREKLATLQHANAETVCPNCGTIRGAVDALCLHCGYNPNEIEAPQYKSGKKRLITMAAVIAGIAIIAALVALPYVKDIMAKMRMEQDFKLAFDVRNQVAAFIDQTNFFPNQNMDANLPDKISSEAIASIVISENAKITITMNDVAAGKISGQTLIFTPRVHQGKVIWNCTQGTLANEFRPEVCRK